MDRYQAWLAAMPVDAVQRRIAELEQELAVMRLLDAQRNQTRPVGPPHPAAVSAGPDRLAIDVVDAPRRRRRSRVLSPERVAIIEVISQHPEGLSPTDVARALGKQQNAVQTAMSRMVQADPPQLVRVAQGRYMLPPPTSTDAAAELVPASGSEGEAMQP